MKAALYIRVSTEDQAIYGFSLPAQLSLLTEYCTRNNIDVYDTYIDEGISGQKENRPQFQRVIKDAEKRLFNIILVHKFDRFARKVELSQRTKNHLAECNVTLISITEPLEDSPMGFFVGGLHDLMSEYFVRNLSVEVKKGMVQRASKGMYNGRVPYGYRIENGKLIIKEDEAEVIRKVFELYIDGMGKQAIASWLREHKILYNDREWGYSDVDRALRCQKYIGNIYFSGEVYPGNHESIIDLDTWNKAQRTRDRKFRNKPDGTANNFLLLGILKCGYCGRTMRTKKRKMKNGVKWYYVCNGADRLRSFCPQAKYWQQDKLEKYIIDYLRHQLNDAKLPLQTTNKISITNIITQSKVKLQSEIERAEKAYLAGVFSLEKFIEIKKENEAKIKEFEETIPAEIIKEEDKKHKQELKTLLKLLKSKEPIEVKKKTLMKYVQSISVADVIDIIFYERTTNI